MADAIAKAYADALFEIAVDENKCDEYRKIVHCLKDTLNDDFVRVLTHPKISKQEKKQSIEEVYGQFGAVVVNFLKVLIDKNRFQYVHMICDEFDANYVEHFKIIQASVTSARELSSDEKQRLNEKLEKKFSQSVECTYAVDEKLLAGIKVQVKDIVYDNTAINRLTKMKDSIMG